MKRTFSRALLPVLAAALAFAAGCTNKQGETESPVYMTTNITGTQSLTFNIAPGAGFQLGTVIVTSFPKNSGVTDPQGFQTIQLSSYVVKYTRLDGGTSLPNPPQQSFAISGTIPLGGSITLSGLPVITPAASQQSPFDQLLPFNGGIDQQTGQPTINVGVTVTFFGETVAGTRVSSAPVTFPVLVFFSTQ
jgi:hypothetical protein